MAPQNGLTSVRTMPRLWPLGSWNFAKVVRPWSSPRINRWQRKTVNGLWRSAVFGGENWIVILRAARNETLPGHLDYALIFPGCNLSFGNEAVARQATPFCVFAGRFAHPFSAT